MIYCPKCGTANRQGSRFCNECGAPLPSQTGLRCPMCGTMNPVGNVYCDNCNARLIPLSAQQPSEEKGEEQAGRPPIKGLSLPTIPLGEEAPPSPETPVGEETDWLAELRATADEAEEEIPSPPEEIEAVEIPDWLAAPEAAPPAPPAEEAPAEEAPAEVPERLAELEAAPPAPPAEEAPAEEAPAEVPEWLAELEAAPPAPPAEETPAEEAPAEVPEWLAELEAAPPAPPAEETPAEEAPAEVPEWLAELEAAPPVETPPQREAETPPELPEQTPPVAPVFVSEEGLPVVEEEEGLPDWLAELASDEEGTTTPPVSAALLPQTEPLTIPPEEGLIPAEIPDWLQELRPHPEAEAATKEPAETEGLLEGLRGTLSPSTAIEMPDTTARPAPVAPSAAAIARARLLQELLGRPAAPPQPARRERRRRIGWTVQRFVVGLLLILSIVTPMVISVPLFTTPSAPAAGRLFEVIQQEIEPDVPVLVAFEYGPAEADEMNRVAAPILRHLLDQNGRLVVVSTRPEGPAVAERLLAGLIPNAQERARRAVNLGYQPGQATGVQALLAGLNQRTEVNTGIPAAQIEAMEGVHTAADVAMVVVLAAQPDDLRTWIEQTSLGYPDLPLVAGVSARVEPLAAPYLDPGARQLRGLVAGLTGAAAYEARLGTSGRAAFYLNSLGIAQLTVIVLMLLGAFIFLAGGRGR
ncbi:MAG TPA: zinc ribbon domain-containing protein [Chloroflexi bacterium]|nr:zinc ribbon domain-containing protein [Chloroflexota bacterium]